MVEHKSEAVSNDPSRKKSIADLFFDLPYRHYSPKQMIIFQGDKIDKIYYIISGYVRVYNITAKGNERTLVIIGPGEAIPLIQSENAHYFYEAITNVETAYGTYEEIVERFLAHKEYMDVAREAGVLLMQRMLELLEVVSYENSVEKVEQAVKFLVKYYGEGDDNNRTMMFKITHQELANMVNLSRETVTNNINKLLKEKAFELSPDGKMSTVTKPKDKKSDETYKKLRNKLTSAKFGALSNTEISV